MGFNVGVASSAVMPSDRTYVQAVDRVLRACGITPTGSISDSQSERTEQAKIAVTDAAEMIYGANLWQFRYRWRMFSPEDLKMFYDLPNDWAGRGSFALQRAATDHDAGADLSYIDYHHLLELVPNLRLVPGDIITEGGLSEAVAQTTFINEFSGVPEQFFIIGNKLGLYPCPSEARIAELGTSYLLDYDYVFGFYGTMPKFTASESPIPLPRGLLAAHHFMALAYFKQAAEYGDFVADERRGEALLRTAIAQSLQQQGPHDLGDFSHGIEV